MRVKVKEDHQQKQEEKAFDMRIVAKDYFLYLEESWKYEPPEDKTEEKKLWFLEIRGRNGVIYPYNETTLAAIIFLKKGDKKIKFSKKDKEIGISLDCDNEIMLMFSPKHLEKVCGWIQAHKKRKIGDLET